MKQLVPGVSASKWQRRGLVPRPLKAYCCLRFALLPTIPSSPGTWATFEYSPWGKMCCVASHTPARGGAQVLVHVRLISDVAEMWKIQTHPPSGFTVIFGPSPLLKCLYEHNCQCVSIPGSLWRLEVSYHLVFITASPASSLASNGQ